MEISFEEFVKAMEEAFGPIGNPGTVISDETESELLGSEDDDFTEEEIPIAITAAIYNLIGIYQLTTGLLRKGGASDTVLEATTVRFKRMLSTFLPHDVAKAATCSLDNGQPMGDIDFWAVHTEKHVERYRGIPHQMDLLEKVIMEKIRG